MRRLSVALMVFMVVLCGISMLPTMPVYAAKDVCSDLDEGDPMKEVLGCTNSNDATIGSVANAWIATILSFVGLAAVVMIIIGGIFYIKSMGDPGKAKKARDTIIYGVVGLVVTLLAFAIVALVTEGVGGFGKL